MTTLLAAADFNYVWMFAGIGAVVGYLSGSVLSGTVEAKVNRLAFQVTDLQNKLDALLKHQGVVMPESTSDLSPQLQLMAKDPYQKIAAIKLYREEHPGTGLAEAKERIERFYHNGR